MRRVRNICFIALGALVVVFVAAGVAWAVDTHRNDDRVERNTTLAGRSIGGLKGPQLEAAVAAVAEKYRSSAVVIEAPDSTFTTNASDLGMTIDTAATVRDALRVGRRGNVVSRIRSWASGFLHDHKAPVRVSVDEKSVRAVIDAKDQGPKTAPVEPVVKAKPGGTGFTIVDGKPGKGIDPLKVVRALPTAAVAGGPVRVKVDRGEVDPRYSTADAENLQKQAEAATNAPLPVTAGATSASIPSTTLRSWTSSQVADDGMHLVVDAAMASSDLAKLMAKATTPAQETTFTLSNGAPVAKLGTAGSACCADDAPQLVQRALFGTDKPILPLKLPMKPVPPTLDAAAVAKLGIKEQVSTFTTNYPAGQPRVTNIHRMADIVKGTVIMPGETFSLNGTVGERTLAKGFVVDHQINDKGEFDEAVGGGVSQFATTTFNAAFFAGLDYGEYQSHTIYISRYPYGREATVSWQHPDLQVKNTTPYGIMLWATYTDTSITVSMYSTKYMASVTQSGQTSSTFGPNCTRVTTERTRKYLDGRTVVDHVFANYQPEEGVKCN
jgi:vancomycin resistance protein YoaR